MVDFLKICLSRAGANSMITPREMLRDYMTVLNILMQNPECGFYDIVGTAVTLRTAEDEEDEADGYTSVPENAAPAAERRVYTPDDIEF
jgi:hypothetical protein